MSSRIECFWMEPTERGRWSLRRYEERDWQAKPPPSCPANRMLFHDTSIVLGDVDYPFDERRLLGQPGENLAHDDPRWPTVCDVCGTPFRETDNWQSNVNRLFTGAPDGKLYTTRDMPPGAMFNADWWPRPGPDGIVLAVVLPPAGGDADIWMVDGTANNGPGWTRKGKPPKVTASPSILTPRYHGFLTDGFLVEC